MKRVIAAGFAATMIGIAGAASAATIDFDSGSLSGGVYSQDGFVYQGVAGSTVATPSDCGSRCARLQNESSGHIYSLSRADGGMFTLESFTFNGRDGEAPALYASTSLVGGVLAGTIHLFSETFNGNRMSSTGLLSQFMDVTTVYFQSAGDGSARIDDIVVSDTPVVPLPAAGFLLLGGLAAFGLMGRRKAN